LQQQLVRAAPANSPALAAAPSAGICGCPTGISRSCRIWWPRLLSSSFCPPASAGFCGAPAAAPSTALRRCGYPAALVGSFSRQAAG